MSALQVLQKKITAGEIPLLQLWYGEDRYSMIEGLRLLKQHFLKADPSGSSIQVFSGKEAQKLEEVVAAARTPGFFSGRLVVVDSFVQGKADEDDGGMTQLLTYCQETGRDTLSKSQTPRPPGSGFSEPPPEDCQNCLVIMAEKMNRTRKLYKVMAKEGLALEFVCPGNYREWQEWVRAEAGRHGKKISASGSGFLLDWCGRHVGILSQELAKCALYGGARQEIRNTDIEQVCVARGETSIFVLLDAIAQRRMKEALIALRNVLDQDYYMRVHGMIVRHIRLLLAGCLVRAKTGSAGLDARDVLMKVTGIRSPYEAGKMLTQSGLFRPDQLVDYLAACLDTEVKIKSGGGEARFLLEVMVVEFCRN
ncbi:MAG: DNA polymerase III subunit delta [Peptococcaceae bacterium]|nr:DNA polymerase III subunit delta [Peptococcaceae bacterium]